MSPQAAPAEYVVRRYFLMWNTGDVAIAPEVLAPDWVDHAHPDLAGPAGVQQAVARAHADGPGLRFHIDAVLGTDTLLSVVGGVGHVSRPDAIDVHLVWLVRLAGGRMAEMWTYRRTTT